MNSRFFRDRCVDEILKISESVGDRVFSGRIRSYQFINLMTMLSRDPDNIDSIKEIEWTESLFLKKGDDGSKGLASMKALYNNIPGRFIKIARSDGERVFWNEAVTSSVISIFREMLLEERKNIKEFSHDITMSELERPLSGFISYVNVDELASDYSPEEKQLMKESFLKESEKGNMLFVPKIDVSKEDLMLFNNITQNDKSISFMFGMNPRLEGKSMKNFGFKALRNMRGLFRASGYLSPCHVDVRLVSSYQATCSCGSVISNVPEFKINGTTEHYRHPCVSLDGKKKFNAIPKSSWVPYNHLIANMYSFKSIDGEEEFYICSFDDYTSGFYEMDMIFFSHSQVGSREEPIEVVFIFGCHRIEHDNSSDEFTVIPGISESWAKERGLLPHKLLDCIFSARELIKRYGKMDINDYGMWAQIVTTLISLGRRYFRHYKLWMAIVGDTDISKTFSIEMLGNVFTPRFVTNTSTKISIPGIAGGLEDSNIGNNKKRFMEKGSISLDGISFFDEANIFLKDRDLINLLKDGESLLYERKIRGGRKVPYISSLLLCMNPERTYQDTSKNSSWNLSYVDEIAKIFHSILRKDESYVPEEIIGNLSLSNVKSYLRKEVNLYLPPEYYSFNPALQDAVIYVRDMFDKDSRNWYIDCDLATSTRIVFKICCLNKGIGMNSFSDIPILQSSKIDFSGMPLDSFRKSVDDYIGISPDSPYDFTRPSKNKDDRIKQIKRLDKDISDFLDSLPRSIKSQYLYRGGEKKIGKSIKEAFVILQLLNDCNATSIDESTKKLLYALFYMNSRGLSLSEYNFEKVNFEIEDFDASAVIDKVDKIRIEEESQKNDALFKEAVKEEVKEHLKSKVDDVSVDKVFDMTEVDEK